MKAPKCQKAFGEHRHRHEIPAGASKTAGGNENGTQADQPGGTGCGGTASIRNEAGEEKGKEALTLTIIPLKYSGTPICSMATFAAFQEGRFIRKGH